MSGWDLNFEYITFYLVPFLFVWIFFFCMRASFSLKWAAAFQRAYTPLAYLIQWDTSTNSSKKEQVAKTMNQGTDSDHREDVMTDSAINYHIIFF